ncbi:hypothetical protein X801_03639 [Opisthorchis viverrini]|uniref:Uncharacterized protein n=1 Tax=Opisthorchis viverrini TaxID=6198 RepID=A0A1S8X1B8_OPIVI|nr:hypothetical protein X801_03639 [Opisthorchis viverrini]
MEIRPSSVGFLMEDSALEYNETVLIHQAWTLEDRLLRSIANFSSSF